MQSNIWLLLPVLLPILGGLAVLHLHERSRRRFIVIALMVAQLVLLIPAFQAGGEELHLLELAAGIRLVLRLDDLGRLFSGLVCIIWFLVTFFAEQYMDHEERRERFFGFYLITLGAMMGICFAGNLVTLYMFYEMMTLCSFPLVLHSGTRESFAAAWRYLAFSVTGAALGLMGLFLLQGYCSTDLFTLGGVLDPAVAGGNKPFLLTVFLIMAVGFGAKAGMFPLHAWLPVAHPVAPGPASAVLSGLITKMGICAILRVTYYLYGWEFLSGTWVQKAALVLALLTILMGSTLALREDVMKKRLAWSTVSQVSYVIFGIMLLTPTGLEGALFQVVFHAIAKNALFLSVAAIIYRTGLTRASELQGIGITNPVCMWCFTIGALSLIGIPPTGGFFAKWKLAQGALDSTLGPLAYVGIAILMISALLTAGYLLPVVINAFFPGDWFDRSALQPQKPLWLIWVPLLVLAAAAVVLGIFPTLVSPLVEGVVYALF